jgi:hypothetical protein
VEIAPARSRGAERGSTARSVVGRNMFEWKSERGRVVGRGHYTELGSLGIGSRAKFNHTRIFATYRLIQVIICADLCLRLLLPSGTQYLGVVSLHARAACDCLEHTSLSRTSAK